MPSFRSLAGAAALALLLCAPSAASASQADLLVSTPELNGTPVVGQTAAYTANVYSYGPDTTDVTVTDALGANESFVSASTTQGSCTQAVPAVCTIGSLAPGVVVQVTITVAFTKAGAEEHALTASGAPDNADPDPTYDTGRLGVTVAEPEAEEVEAPEVTTGSWEATQSTLKVDAELAPHGEGTWHFEYGKTKSYGSKTKAKAISGDATVKRKALLTGLALDTKYHFRVVLEVGGKTYRGKDVTGRTLGRLDYPLVTLKAKKRSASSTTYTGSIGDGLADAPGACKGRISLQVYTTANVNVLARSTKVDAATCTYEITIPFGTRDARKLGPKGTVLVQARFSGTKAVANTGSRSDRP